MSDHLIIGAGPKDEQFVQERPALDLNLQHFSHVSGDLRIIGTWFLAAVPHAPVLAIIPKIIRPGQTVRPCVVFLDDAWKWAEPPLGDAVYVAEQVFSWGDPLGINLTSDAAIFKVIDAVRENLGELVLMPPCPRLQQKVMGHITQRDADSGEITRQEEIRDDG